MGDLLLQTKLHAPPARKLLVSRPRLTARLNAGLSGRLTLISAPAGFGKSTLVSSWFSGQRNAAWLALDQGDNEPRVFWQYVIAAIRTVVPGFGTDAQQFLQSQKFKTSQPVLVNILNEISDNSLELQLVLDDYHVIAAQEVHESVGFFLERLPSTVHLVLLTRVDPPFSLGRFRANNDLSEIRSADLQFNTEESGDFLRQVMDLDLQNDQVRALNHRTEGWVAGLQMAGLSIQGLNKPEQVAAFIDDFTGSHRHIFDYLTDEVLSHQTPEKTIFLLQTSLLDQFNASLCAAVTGKENSQTMLESMEGSNLFLFPLDEERRWYRYHHLFATSLQRRLMHHPDLDPARLNQLAADWFEAHGMVDQAIHHLQKGDNLEDMVRLINEYGVETLQPGQLHRLKGWLDALPVEIVQTDVLLACLQAWTCYFEQQTEGVSIWVEHVRCAVEHSLNQSRDHIIEAQGTILGLQSWVACQRRDYQLGVQLAKTGLERLPVSDHTWRGKLYILLAEALAGTGRTSDAIAAYETSFQYSQDGSNWIATSAITAAIWMTKMLRGQLKEARGHFDRIISDLADQGLLFNTSSLRMARLAILYEQNDLDQVGTELLDLWKIIQFDSTIETARHHYLYAKYCTSVGNFDLAYRSLQKLEEEAIAWNTPDEQARAIGGCMRIYLRLGERQRIDQWLQSVDYDPGSLTLLRIDEYLAIADALRIQDSSRDRQLGLQLADGLLQLCDDLEIFGIKIDVYCLKALLLASDEMTAALKPLAKALSAGESEGYVRTFVDYGQPMADLLSEAITRDIHAEYAGFLLSQFLSANETSLDLKALPVLIEPLTDRELEVLSLLASHLSGPQIAGQLHISPNTLKTHVRRIYRKLGVRNRNNAVMNARVLDLL